ncbi:MAG: cell envelope biogenesis protein OmpA [Bdellovibrionales bacterium]|nr:cell envelope biogenesis protein OmpA [Bdellovibrionales bacterium]
MSKIVPLLIVLFLSACASRPQLYPNTKLKAVGQDEAKKDIDSCMADAENYLKSSKGKNIAKGAGAGAAIGATMGTVGGMFTGNMGSGLMRGGAIGAAGGGTAGALSPDQIKRRFVNQCLADKGYRVLGWD